MAADPAFVITTLAEYQTRFWLPVARHLQALGVRPSFVSFDDRSSEMIARAGLPVVGQSEIEAVASPSRQAEIFARFGIDRLAFLTSHERFAFGRTDTAAMHEKLARSALAAERAIALARDRGGEVAMVQEVGGFLSVIGSFFAARAGGIDNWFIEPSFFRGRMSLTTNSFAAPAVAGGECAPTAEMRDYVEQTLARGAIVIPEKDAHQYRPAVTKVVNFKNARRLAEKLTDKYLLGKRQEFGFIGKQVGSHLTMIANSRKLKRHYTDLDRLDRFVYYPLHVPGDMALTLRSPQYLDQLALVDYLCRMLPDGSRLALKEHPAMVGALDADRLIALLKRYDNLALIPPTANNYAVMRRARCVVTVNSKSGAEAGLLGKNVFVLGDAFYRGAPFATAIDALTDLPSRLAAELADPPADAAPPAQLGWFACLWRQSWPGELYAASEEKARQFAQSLQGAIAAG
jgi:Capsule polysaccharide biosynthesis protein